MCVQLGLPPRLNTTQDLPPGGVQLDALPLSPSKTLQVSLLELPV